MLSFQYYFGSRGRFMTFRPMTKSITDLNLMCSGGYQRVIKAYKVCPHDHSLLVKETVLNGRQC